MPTLAPKLPYNHQFAGGYPRVAGQPTPTDPDCLDYLARLSAADGGAGVEVGVAMAIQSFIQGCKADSAGYAGDPTRSNWDAIQAACIMCGARTVAGATVPLKTPYGSELVDIDALPTPTIYDGYGSTGGWNAETRTLTSTTVGTSASYPRFTFQLGMTVGKRYRAVIKFSGDLSILYGARIASGTYLQPTGVAGEYAITAAAGWSYMEIDLACNVTTGSVTIESLSIREDSFTPTPYNFASGDYSRGGATPGLKGDGSTKYINSNRAANADGQDDSHHSVYATNGGTNLHYKIGSRSSAGCFVAQRTTYLSGANRPSAYQNVAVGDVFSSATLNGNATGFYGASRSDATDFAYRMPGGSGTHAAASVAPDSLSNYVFAFNNAGSLTGQFDGRLAFYSIGSALDLSLLDARVTSLVRGIQFAQYTGLSPADYDDDTVSYIVNAYINGGTL